MIRPLWPGKNFTSLSIRECMVCCLWEIVRFSKYVTKRGYRKSTLRFNFEKDRRYINKILCNE